MMRRIRTKRNWKRPTFAAIAALSLFAFADAAGAASINEASESALRKLHKNKPGDVTPKRPVAKIAARGMFAVLCEKFGLFWC